MQTRIRPFDVVPLALAAAIAFYGLYLLVVGTTGTFVIPDGARTIYQERNVAGIIPVVAGVLVWLGIAKGTNRLAWAGGAVAAAFSLLFVFSIGGIVIPVAGALLAALAVRWLLGRR